MNSGYVFNLCCRTAPLFLLLLQAAGCKPGIIPPPVQKGIDSIIAIRVPDKREALCECTLQLTSGMTVVLRGETTIPEAKDDITGFLADAGYEVVDSLRVLPGDDIARKWGLVTVSVCNMMNKPSFSGEQVSQSLMGTPVMIIRKSGGWILIQTPDHYLGWISGSSVSEKNDDEMTAWKGSSRIVFLNRAGYILGRSDAGTVISDITAGAILEMTGTENRYYLVRTPDGREGRVSRDDAAGFDEWVSSVSPDPQQMIRFARSMTGFPYMWGGTSTKAVDCSGFVKTIYLLSGRILARDASQQFLYGKPIDVSLSTDLLIPGDLVFFGSLNDDGSERITHVGMYTGDTEVIHSSGMVRINSLDPDRENYSDHLRKTMLGARRLIGEESQKGFQSISDHNWYFN